MSNSMKISLYIYTAIALLVVITGIWKILADNIKKPEEPRETPVEVLCISEKGDTVARWKTLDTPKIWSDGGVTCATGFKDLETGVSVEVRTRTGTIIICQ